MGKCTKNNQKKPTFLRSQKGGVLIYAMIIAAVLPALMFPLISKNLMFANQVKDTQQSFKYGLVLGSIKDYTLLGIKQKWCFNDSWLRDNNCSLSHNKNIERLVISNQQYESLVAMKAKGLNVPDPKSVRLKKISHTLYYDTISQSHPLYNVTSILGENFIDSIQIDIERYENIKQPTKGDEVIINLHIQIVPKNKTAFKNTHLLASNSKLVVFPREIGIFGLIVANDLHLDYNSAVSTDKGDAVIASVGNKAQVQKSGGIRFESPIFVNGNIHLPSKGAGYSPVTFVDRVVLGNGTVFVGGQPDATGDSESFEERFYSQSKSFGGFLGGIQTDGERDQGLDVFSGKITGTLPDKSLMNLCLQRNLARSDLRETSDSSLVLKVVKNDRASKEYQVKIGLSKQNEFMKQNGRAKILKQKGQIHKDTILADSTSNKQNNPILTLELKFKDHYLKADLALDSKLSFFPQFKEFNTNKSNRDMDKITNEIVKYNSAIANLEEQNKSLMEELQPINDEISSLQEELENVEKNYTGADKEKKIKDLQVEIKKIEKQNAKKLKTVEQNKEDIEKFKAIVVAKEKLIADEQASIYEYLQRKQNPPEFTIELNPHLVNNSVQPNIVNLDFKINNSQYMDELPEINIEAFDFGFNFKRNLRLKARGTRKVGYSTLAQFQFSKSATDDDPEISLDNGIVLEKWVVADKQYRNHPKYGIIIKSPEENVDYTDLEKKCNNTLAVDGAAFGVADWSYSFANKTRHSWSFADPVDGVLELTESDSFLGAGSFPDFKVRSIVKECHIKATANFVSGFLTCEKLVIEARSKPLRIIGTIIAGNAVIHSSAAVAGIRWSSIYHPNSVFELREAKILKPMAGECIDNNSPIWHPYPSVPSLINAHSCNPISLRERAQPFTWSQVDPDCGLIDGYSNVICKNRPVRYLVKDIGGVSQ